MFNKFRQLPCPIGGDAFCLLANCFLLFSRCLAVLIFLTLLADFKDPIENRNRVPVLWT